MTERTKQAIARLREASEALDALDQCCGEDPLDITDTAHRCFEKLNKDVNLEVRYWNDNLENGDQALYECRGSGVDPKCERWTVSADKKCGHCTEREIARAEREYDRVIERTA